MNSGDHPDPDLYKKNIKDAFTLLKALLNTDCTRRVTAIAALEFDFLKEEEMEGNDSWGEEGDLELEQEHHQYQTSRQQQQQTAY